MVSIGAVNTSHTTNSDSYNNDNNNNSSSSIINNHDNNHHHHHHHNGDQAGSFTNITGTTNAGPTSLVPLSVGVQVEEILIVFLIVVFWVLAVAAFRRKWDSIRIMQPMEPRYKHIPKNLDSVKVVKRAQDSIIYKTYSRKMSVTMSARENRHLQRTLTMPCMNSLPSFQSISNPSQKAKQTLPTIHMEEVTTEM